MATGQLNLTSEEAARLRRALKNETFREMLCDYAREISDPDNKKRYEEEITLLERQRGMEVRFLHPAPVRALRIGSTVLNVCSSEALGRPECSSARGPKGERGHNWSLPYSVTPGRKDRLDAKGDEHLVYDVVFHPETLRLAHRDPKFMRLVDDTAIQGVETHYGVKLQRDNVEVLKTKYVGAPNQCVIRKPIPGHSPEPGDPGDPLAFPYPHADQPAQPKYTIAYRSYVDLQDCGPGHRPREMVIAVHLPGMKSASGAELDVSERQLILCCRCPPYRLQLQLSHAVDEQRGRAQLNKEKETLTITLPLKKPPPGEGAKLYQGEEEEPLNVEEEEDVQEFVETTCGKTAVELGSSSRSSSQSAGEEETSAPNLEQPPLAASSSEGTGPSDQAEEPGLESVQCESDVTPNPQKKEPHHSQQECDNTELELTDTNEVTHPKTNSKVDKAPLLGEDVGEEELDEDDLLGDEITPAVLTEINSQDGKETVISDHHTHAEISFFNSLLFQLD